MPDLRIVVLASGAGTLLQALLDSDIGRRIVAVGSDQSEAPALARARAADVPTFVVPMAEDREVWNIDLVQHLQAHEADFVVTAGFMRVLGRAHCTASIHLGLSPFGRGPIWTWAHLGLGTFGPGSIWA